MRIRPERFGLTILALLPAMISCFGSREAVKTRYYVPAPPLMGGAPGRVLSQSLAVSEFTLAPHLAGDRIAARLSPSEIEYYSQHRWAGPLDQVVTQESRKHLRNFFQAVLDGASEEAAELVLSGTVELFEEEDEKDGWYGHAAMSLTLTNAKTGDPIWTGHLESRKKTSARNPGAVAEALGQALSEILLNATQNWGKLLPEK